MTFYLLPVHSCDKWHLCFIAAETHCINRGQNLNSLQH